MMTEVSEAKTQNPGASASAIQFHYDIGNDFYHLWLDETKTYTCALWEQTSNLEAAQIAKLDYHIREARATGSNYVLDIGCGWGCALQHMVKTHAINKAVGLTLSQAQADYISQQNWTGVEVLLESWSDHQPGQPYDAIVSIGAFEHFARPELTVEQKIEGYKSFFSLCHQWLKPKGWMSLQTITNETASRKDFHPFIAKDIWPETDLPCLSDIAVACRGKFEIHCLRNDREDYVRTLRSWINSIEENREAAVRLVGEDIVQRYERWFKLSIIGFYRGTMGLLRITFRRIDAPSEVNE
jgi:cyclopropane-fatty-acyl-phospholipid synthase